MSHRDFKDRLYAEFARIGAGLASERRLELLDLLAQGPRRVDALAAETGLSVANASQHLQVLRRARLVETERSGNSISYRLASDSVLDLWLALRRVAEDRLAEIAALRSELGLDSRDESIDAGAIASLVARGDVVLLDVRPQEEFAHGHLPGARSLPYDDLANHLDELPRDRRIVTYCRGRYCLFADDAVVLLREHGFDAVRLDDGWLEWRAGAADPSASLRPRSVATT